MSTIKPTAETLASQAYRYLHEKLLSGEFEQGSRLRYVRLGKEIGISATPMREAAGKLAQEGLIELVPQIGAVVKTLNTDDLREIYEVREVIEPYTAAKAAERATPRETKQIRSWHQTMTRLTRDLKKRRTELADKKIASEFRMADYRFHMSIIEACGNQVLTRTASHSHVLTRVFGVRRRVYDSALMISTCEEHEAILNAIEQKVPKSAFDRSVAHIREGLRLALDASAQTKPQPAAAAS